MAAGRKPKPAGLHDLEGTRNRHRNKGQEPIFGGVPTCPKHLSKAAKAEWKRVSTELGSTGLLTSVDRAALAAYCSAWARWVEAEEKIKEFGMVAKSPKSGYPIQNPYVSISNTSLDQMRKFAAEFGMTPSSRTKIRIESPATAADPFEEFMKGLGADKVTESVTDDEESRVQ
jgi:P27 family predicted phage terminase small subunit